MCMHDPESEAIQTQNALKLGRQKKIQVVNGEELKIVPGEEHLVKDEIIESDSKMLKNELGNQLIEGTDGQHYVVLEVIQLQGSDGEQAVAVVSEGDFQGNTMSIEDTETVSTNQYITPDYGN